MSNDDQYDATWETAPACDLHPEQLLAVALHQATHAGTPREVTGALAELDRAVHAAPNGFERRLRQARTENLVERLAAGGARSDLARELGVSQGRITQLIAGNRGPGDTHRPARPARPSVRDDLAAARVTLRAHIVAQREADRVARGEELLVRVEAGETPRALAAEMAAATGADVPWQAVTTLLTAAKDARKGRTIAARLAAGATRVQLMAEFDLSEAKFDRLLAAARAS
jgi:uncharacterized protein (DUF433 family)